MFSKSQVDRAGDVLRADPTDAQALRVLEWMTSPVVGWWLTPSPLGYRGIHLLVRVDARRAEVQVRTRRQHAWARMVEAHDSETHDDAKHGHAPETVIAGLFAMSEILFTLDQQHFEEDT